MNIFNLLTESGSFPPSLIGDGIIILVLLIFACVGIKKGFLGLIVGFLGFFMVFIVAFLLYKPVSLLILNSSLGASLTNSFEGFFDSITSSASDVVKTLLTSPLKDLKDAEIQSILTELNLPDFLISTISNMIQDSLSNAEVLASGITIKSVVIESLVNMTVSAIAWIAMFVIASVVMFILRRFVNVFNRIPIIGSANRLLGALLNLIIGFIIVCLITGLFILISPVLPQSVIDYVNSCSILGWLYNNNPIAYIFTWFIK